MTLVSFILPEMPRALRSRARVEAAAASSYTTKLQRTVFPLAGLQFLFLLVILRQGYTL